MPDLLRALTHLEWLALLALPLLVALAWLGLWALGLTGTDHGEEKQNR